MFSKKNSHLVLLEKKKSFKNQKFQDFLDLKVSLFETSKKIVKTSSETLTNVSTNRSVATRSSKVISSPKKIKKSVSFAPSEQFIEVFEYVPDNSKIEEKKERFQKRKEDVKCGCFVF